MAPVDSANIAQGIDDDDNEVSCAVLRKEYENTKFFCSGGIKFERPNILKVLEDHTIELINTRTNAHSLLVFCGAPHLAHEIHYNKISNNMITVMTGHCRSHIMDYVSESYGGKKAIISPGEKKRQKKKE